MNDCEKLAEFISFVNVQMAQTQEEKDKLKHTLDEVKQTFKIKIGGILDIWEKDIEAGKITEEKIIQSIRGLRERYNNMFAGN